jgi:hypothetical protein
VGQVAQVVLDLTEGLVFGQIDEALGRGAQDLLGVGAVPGNEGLDAGFAVFRGLGRCKRDRVQHEGLPGVAPLEGFGFPATPRG